MANVQFLPKVIQYDRFQPEFYEDTKTYVSKRTSQKKVNKGITFYKENLDLINNVEKNFNIEKELLLSLMGIETNYGTYVGKMDILSSLSTLSYDKRRSQFFTNELLILLKLIDSKKLIIKLFMVHGLVLLVFFNSCRLQLKIMLLILIVTIILI